MASRTYLPQLLFIIKWACKYMLKYDALIRSHLGGGAAEAAFDACLAACQVFVPFLEALIPNPT
jgi:hypothetical protein